MNGQLFLVLIAMLLQNSGADVLPTPNRSLPAPLPSAFPATPPILPTDPARARCTTGYGTDPQDGKFCLIIQIAPDAIGAFAKGTMGQELAANVPDEIRNLRIDKVIVRVGSSPVERNLPNPQMLSQDRPSSSGDNYPPKTPFYNPIKPHQNNLNSGYATTGQNGYYDSSTANPGIYAGATPSQAQSQQYGALPTQQPTPYLSSNQYPPGTNNPSFATMPIPVPRQNYPPVLIPENTVDEQTLGKDKLLPFLLLFSIVCNVYLGFWMSHLRTRYRQLLSNMRGIPVSDLA